MDVLANSINEIEGLVAIVNLPKCFCDRKMGGKAASSILAISLRDID